MDTEKGKPDQIGAGWDPFSGNGRVIMAQRKFPVSRRVERLNDEIARVLKTQNTNLRERHRNRSSPDFQKRLPIEWDILLEEKKLLYLIECLIKTNEQICEALDFASGHIGEGGTNGNG